MARKNARAQLRGTAHKHLLVRTAERVPVRFTESHYKQIEDMAGFGMKPEQIGRVLGLTPDTFQHCIDKDPRIPYAMNRGRELAIKKVSKSLVTQAEEGNVQAIIWFEKTRAGFSDRITVIPGEPEEDELREVDRRIDRIAARVRTPTRTSSPNGGSQPSGNGGPTS